MEEIIFTDQKIKKRMVSGFFILGVRRVIFQVILTVGNIALARILVPEIFGLFIIVSFLVTTAAQLSSFGLIQALIQKKEAPTKIELRVMFSVLLATSLLFALLIYLLAPYANHLYRGILGETGIFWLRLFSLNLVLINIAAISIALLERNLEYKKLTIGELIAPFLTQASIIIFALKGFGVGSFVLGTLVGSFASFIIFLIFSPWPVGVNFSFSKLKPFLPFGLNYQANMITSSINNAIIPGFVGIASGAGAVGFLNWASGIKEVGLAPTELFGRLAFPACSRAQGRTELLKSLIEKMIKFSCLLGFPLIAAIFALAPSITYIVYTSKWLPGLTALYLSLAQSIFLVLMLILIPVLLALGEAKTVRNISIFWTILQWVLTVPLVLIWGYNGAALAGLLVLFTIFIPLHYVRKKVEINLWPNVLPYLIYSLLCGLMMFRLTKIFTVVSIWQILFIGFAGGLFYLGIVWFFKKKEIINDFVRLKELIT